MCCASLSARDTCIYTSSCPLFAVIFSIAYSYLLTFCLCVGAAYHNLAVELEHLRQDDEALAHYIKARDVAQRYIGPSAPVTVVFRDALEVAIKVRIQCTAL